MKLSIFNKLKPSNMGISEKELCQLIRLSKKVLWSEPEIRERLQQNKINIVPSNFYSEVPSVEDIRNSFEYRDNNKPVYDRLIDHNKTKEICNLIYPYSEEFDPPMKGNKDNPEGFFWENPAFSHLDAMMYYCMIRHFKPKKILEIGSGFSTLVADMAIKKNGFGEIISIEPYPMSFLKNIESVTKIIQKKVQDIPLPEIVELVEDSDVWFIDSTHTVKIGSDCLYIYLKVMPEIKSKTIVHTHDVYLPDGISQWTALSVHIYWTEQYLLYAYLLDNPKVEVLTGVHYLHKYARDQAEQLMHGRGIACKGASFWYSLNKNRE